MNKRRLKKAFKRLNNLPRGRFFFYYITNKVRDAYYRFSNSTLVAYPSTVMLELNNHCNLRCTTCPREYDFGKSMDKGYLKVDEAKKIIDELWMYLDSVGLTGMGETFLSKDIEEIVDYIKEKNKGIIISLSTNAVLPGFIEKTSKLINKVDTIQVSIDGLDEVYESIRINAKFPMLHNNLKQLTELCTNTDTVIMLNVVVTKENYIQLDKMVEYASRNKIKHVNFALFNLAAVTDVDVDYYKFYSSPEFLHKWEELQHAIRRFPDVEVSTWDHKSKNEFQKCKYPWGHFYICWDGYVAPCCAKPFPKELNFGNVFNTGVLNTLNSKSFRAFRKLWYKNKPHQFCKKCHYLELEPFELS